MDLKSVTLLLLTTQYVLQSYQGGLKYFKSLPRTEGSPLSLDLNVETQLFSLADLFLNSFWFMDLLHFQHVLQKLSKKYHNQGLEFIHCK